MDNRIYRLPIFQHLLIKETSIQYVYKIKDEQPGQHLLNSNTFLQGIMIKNTMYVKENLNPTLISQYYL